jgi:hypothetical protein
LDIFLFGGFFVYLPHDNNLSIMRGMIYTTASALKAILCYIDPEKTPKIAYDKDEYAKPLADKIKEALGNYDGSQSVSISFRDNEDELKRQFSGICEQMGEIFSDISNFTK